MLCHYMKLFRNLFFYYLTRSFLGNLMYVCNFMDSPKGCKIFLQAFFYSLLHSPLQSLPSFPSSFSSPLHLTLPPYLSFARQSTSARFVQLFLHASYNYLARWLSPHLGLPFPPSTAFLSIHSFIPSLLFCYFLCLIYLPFLGNMIFIY